MTADVGYVTDRSPGRGRERPRAWFTSSLPVIELAGQWRFRLAAGLGDLSAGFEAADFDDSRWDLLAVPSCWLADLGRRRLAVVAVTDAGEDDAGR